MAKETISKNNQKKTYTNAADVIIVKGSKNKIYTMGGNDKITISKGKNNMIDAGAGNDIITVKAGNKHTLRGGLGSDKYVINSAIEQGSSFSIKQSDYKKKDADTLKLAKVSESDVTYSLLNGKMTIRHGSGGTIAVSGWNKNRLSKIMFKDGTVKASQYKNKIYNVVKLSKNKTYKGNVKKHEEFAVKFSTKTDIVINSASTTADRITFTNSGGWSNEHEDVYVKGNDLIVGNWDPKNMKSIKGQIVVKNFMKSSVKEIDFSNQTYHLITKSGTWSGSNTYSDRFMILDGVKTGSKSDVGDWNVTLTNVRKNDWIDMRALPVNTRYYGIRGDADKKDFVLNYYYTEKYSAGYKEVLLGTIRLKNFFKKDGTMNMTNGYPKIRLNREFYAGKMDDNTFDGLVWERIRGADGDPVKNYRKAFLKAGTSKDETVDLGTLKKTDTKMVWMYYAGGGKDTVTSHAGDIVYGGAGNDTLKAQGRMSDIHGGVGDDIITVQAANGGTLDRVNVYGERGNDTIKAYGSYLYISGGAGTDTISLYNGNNSFVNGGGDDDIINVRGGQNHRVNGNKGDDTITVTGGNGHTLRGHYGTDHYIVESGFDANTRLTIDQRGFADGDTDTLELKAVSVGDVTYDFRDGGALAICHVDGGEILVRGWNANPLDSIIFADGTMTKREIEA